MTGTSGSLRVRSFPSCGFLARNEARTENNARNRNEAQRDEPCKNDVPAPDE